MRRAELALAALLLAAAASAQTAEPRLAPGDREIAVELGGRHRVALAHLPPAAAGDAPLPVLFAFHGGGGNAEAYRAWTDLDATADRAGFLVLYPEGTGRLFERKLLTWNAGACCGYAAREGVDDVGASLALLEELARHTPVDATRVYASGLSNGSMMAFRLAHDAGDRIAGIATVAGVARPAPFAPRRPMPIIHFHSVDDPRALYAGGLGPLLPFLTRVFHPPVEETLRVWARSDGCPGEPRVVEHRSGRAGTRDATHTATLLVYDGCASGAEVQLWKLTGAGHVWPGAPPRYSERLLGAPTQVIDANELLWSFLSRFQLSDAPPLPGLVTPR